MRVVHSSPLLQQELLKVRGFQGPSVLTTLPSHPDSYYDAVAPAELEGHLLDHPDVTDVCVVGLPDEYSGEVPLAFVVPTTAAVERMKKDPGEETRTKESIMKVCPKYLFAEPRELVGRLAPPGKIYSGRSSAGAGVPVRPDKLPCTQRSLRIKRPRHLSWLRSLNAAITYGTVPLSTSPTQR